MTTLDVRDTSPCTRRTLLAERFGDPTGERCRPIPRRPPTRRRRVVTPPEVIAQRRAILVEALRSPRKPVGPAARTQPPWMRPDAGREAWLYDMFDPWAD